MLVSDSAVKSGLHRAEDTGPGSRPGRCCAGVHGQGSCCFERRSVLSTIADMGSAARSLAPRPGEGEVPALSDGTGRPQTALGSQDGILQGIQP